MKRITLIGSGGAGKSTLARELGAALGIPGANRSFDCVPGGELPASWLR